MLTPEQIDRIDPFRKQMRDLGAAVDRMATTLGYEEDYEPAQRDSNVIFRKAVHFEDNPELAVEAVTGVRCWYEDMSLGEVKLLQQWADRLFDDAIRNGEGKARLDQLDAASTALRWIYERMEERREEAPVMPRGHWSGVSQKDFR
jgi:hypothetical protein